MCRMARRVRARHTPRPVHAAVSFPALRVAVFWRKNEEFWLYYRFFSFFLENVTCETKQRSKTPLVQTGGAHAHAQRGRPHSFAVERF
jgi:hypothetical protein